MVSLDKGRNLFFVKRLMLLVLMALVLSTSLALTTGVASAKTTTRALATTSCYNTSCDGRSPISTNCYKDKITMRSATSGFLSGGVMETVNLRFSQACWSVWAEVTFNYALPPLHYGNGAVHRLTDNTEYWCSDSGGNGTVLPGQSSCYTPMVGDYGTLISIADGFYWMGSDWVLEAKTDYF